MSIHVTYALLTFLIGVIAAAALIDWRWLPKESVEDEERRRLNALACDEDTAFHLMDRDVHFKRGVR